MMMRQTSGLLKLIMSALDLIIEAAAESESVVQVPSAMHRLNEDVEIVQPVASLTAVTGARHARREDLRVVHIRAILEKGLI
jgi:hypothetical protein